MTQAQAGLVYLIASMGPERAVAMLARINGRLKSAGVTQPDRHRLLLAVLSGCVR